MNTSKGTQYMTDTRDIALTGGGYDFKVRVYPAERPDGSMLVWLHGGAFMFGTIDMPEADQVGRRLSAAGTTVVSVDYTLAPLDAIEALGPPEPEAGAPTPEQIREEIEAAGPRAHFPVASLQVVSAFDWTVSNATSFGADPAHVSIGGASAGGNIAAGAAMRLRDRATSAPTALVLVYPVLHSPLPEADAHLQSLLEELPGSLTIPPESSDIINRNYLGDSDDREGYAFPGGHDLAGLPPTLIVNADRDRLRASGQAFAAELALAGVDVQTVREQGALHGFLNEIGDEAAERTLALIKRSVAADA